VCTSACARVCVCARAHACACVRVQDTESSLPHHRAPTSRPQWVTLPCFSAAAYMPSLVLERGLFARERGDGLYREATYLANKMVDELALVGAHLVSIYIYVIRIYT
jgi:hypothetical protein